jgi:hypothetical protein
MDGRISKQIVDINGKQTTVWVKPELGDQIHRRQISGVPPHAPTNFAFTPEEKKEAITNLLQDEWGNFAAMEREANTKDRDQPDTPTWGSFLDSLDQMPDDIVYVISGYADVDELRAIAIERAQSEGFDTELPDEF